MLGCCIPQVGLLHAQPHSRPRLLHSHHAIGLLHAHPHVGLLHHPRLLHPHTSNLLLGYTSHTSHTAALGCVEQVHDVII
jgi:hypothetical protein